MEELKKVLTEIQDYLVPILDTYEQPIYHYIFRHTYLIELETTLFSSRSAEIGFGAGAEGAQPSYKSRSKKLKSLELKGAVKILERSHKGMLVAIVLPQDISGLLKPAESIEINIESLDFYKDRRLLPSILEREGYRCFYTGKKITEESCYLDHVIASSIRGDNSYKNIVASSYDANSMKNNKAVNDFIRQLYKEDMISLIEFDILKKKIEALQKGMLVPNKQSVREAVES